MGYGEYRWPLGSNAIPGELSLLPHTKSDNPDEQHITPMRFEGVQTYNPYLDPFEPPLPSSILGSALANRPEKTVCPTDLDTKVQESCVLAV